MAGGGARGAAEHRIGMLARTRADVCLVAGASRLTRDAIAQGLGSAGIETVVDGDQIPETSSSVRIVIVCADVTASRSVRSPALRGIPAVLVGGEPTRDAARAARQEGFSAYVTRTARASQLAGVVRRLLRDPATGWLVVGMRDHPPARSALTRREAEVLDELRRGGSTASIATALGISRHTVRTHVQNIRAKTSTHSRLQLVAMGEGRSPG